jgi:hypothetical protein
VTLGRGDILFRAVKKIKDKFNLDAVLVDRNDEIVKNLTLASGK